MTDFDSGALTSDAEGLRFLKTVLDVPGQTISPDPDAFTARPSTPGWSVSTGTGAQPAVAAQDVSEPA